MKNDYFYIIGLMSGTSLDGIDLVYVKFNRKIHSDFKILFSNTYGYSKKWMNDLKDAITFSEEVIQQLNIDYGVLLSEKINDFIDQFKIKKIDFIASHGHTVFHQPDKGVTLQIGDGQTISNITKQKVVCDFRTQDVRYGGQGAPLVPIGDELLFSDFEYCLNLGGFANVSFKHNDKRIAYDICPVNIVLNKYAQKLGYDYDDKGEIAFSGEYLMDLDTTLRSLDFYKKEAPKSLGLEWVKENIFPVLESSKIKPEDLLRTYTEHSGWAIAKAFPVNAKILVTGGGVFNDYLLSRIKYYKQLTIVVPDKRLVEFKEALVFAFLALLKVDNQVNCLSSVTGAIKDHSSGEVFYPNN